MAKRIHAYWFPITCCLKAESQEVTNKLLTVDCFFKAFTTITNGQVMDHKLSGNQIARRSFSLYDGTLFHYQKPS